MVLPEDGFDEAAVAGAAVAVGWPAVGDGAGWPGVGDVSDGRAASAAAGVAAGATDWVVGCDLGATVAEAAADVAAAAPSGVADAIGVEEGDAFAVGVAVATRALVALAAGLADPLEGVAPV